MSKFYDLVVGSAVGVIKTNSCVMAQGVYTVVKCNGAVVVVERVTDGYARSFSNRTGCEKHLYGNDNRYTTAEIIPLDKYNAIVLAKQRAAELEGLWTDASEAARRKDVFALETIIAKIKQANGAV